MSCKKNCYNCKYCADVYEYIDSDTGKIFFAEVNKIKEKTGKIVVPNSYRCMRYSDYGDKIWEEGLYQEDACDDFEEGIRE